MTLGSGDSGPWGHMSVLYFAHFYDLHRFIKNKKWRVIQKTVSKIDEKHCEVHFPDGP